MYFFTYIYIYIYIYVNMIYIDIYQSDIFNATKKKTEIIYKIYRWL